VAVLLATGAAGPAWAQSVSEAELRALAGRAADDPRALAQLRAVREVDGRPASIGPALAEAEGPVRAARLRALAAGAGSSGETAVEPETARRDAREVLDGRRFQESKVPRPLCFDHYADAGRFGDLHYAVCNLLGEVFLNLQPASEEVDDTSDLG
jgi:hypothetical protein